MTNGVYSAFVATTSADSAPAAHISSEKCTVKQLPNSTQRQKSVW